jgi:hypothetical protein
MIVSSVPSKTGPTQSAAHANTLATPLQSRALVPLQSPAEAPVLYAARPNASFVAHLITMAELAPQTRTLRHETPAVAHGAYNGATAHGANFFGRVLSRTA